MTDSSTEAAPVSISALHATLVHRDELPKDNKTGVASLSVGIRGGCKTDSGSSLDSSENYACLHSRQ